MLCFPISTFYFYHIQLLRCGLQELLHDGVGSVRGLMLDPVRDSLQEPQLIVRNILLRVLCCRQREEVVVRTKNVKSSHFNLSDSSLHLI